MNINLLKDVANITIYEDGVAGGKYQDRSSYGKDPFDCVLKHTATIRFVFQDGTREIAQCVGNDLEELYEDYMLAKQFITTIHRDTTLMHTHVIKTSSTDTALILCRKEG